MNKTKKLAKALDLIKRLKQSCDALQKETCKCHNCEELRGMYREIFDFEKTIL